MGCRMAFNGKDEGRSVMMVTMMLVGEDERMIIRVVDFLSHLDIHLFTFQVPTPSGDT